ncbi:hypothetical protein D3C76_937680 [compost metagenome]
MPDVGRDQQLTRQRLVQGFAQQGPALRGKRRATSGYRGQQHHRHQTLGSMGLEPLRCHASHGMADHAEVRPVQQVGQVQHIPGDLLHGEWPWRLAPRAIAATIHEGIGEALRVKPAVQRIEQRGTGHPAVHHDHLVRPVAELVHGLQQAHQYWLPTGCPVPARSPSPLRTCFRAAPAALVNMRTSLARVTISKPHCSARNA